MKRFLSLFSLIGLLSTGVMPVEAMLFSDTSGTVYQQAFAQLSNQGIIQGYSDGTARPYEPINRAEALKVIVNSVPELRSRAQWYTQHMPPIGLFTDVSESDWFAPYVETAFEQGIVTGYDDNTFRPAQFVRTEEAIMLLMRAHGETTTATVAQQSIGIQNQSNQWYTGAINAAISRNLVRTDSGQLQLGSALTRGQFIDIVYRMHTIRSSGVAVYQETPGSSVAVAPVQQPAPYTPQPIDAGQPAGSTLPSGVVASRTTSAVSDPNASEKFFAVSIPAAGIQDLTITHPTDPFSSDGVLSVLKDGVGHLFSYPGAGGKVMIYGHSSGYPWDVSPYTKIFRQINTLNAGDRIYVTYDGHMYVYEVTHEEAVPADDTSRLNDNGQGEQLILYTCWPPDSISQRYLVYAIPVEVVALR